MTISSEIFKCILVLIIFWKVGLWWGIGSIVLWGVQKQFIEQIEMMYS